MARFFDKYTGVLRNLKVNYVIYNLFKYNQLKRNKSLYKKYGIKKSVVAPLSSKDFAHLPDERPWIDQDVNEASIRKQAGFSDFSDAIQNQILNWPKNGYLIWKSFLNQDEVAAVNEEVDRLIKNKVIDFNYTNKKLMQAIDHSELLYNLANSEKLNRLFEFLLGRKVNVFHSINFQEGSEQKAHSDWIHMSTYPVGNLIAAWLALEPVNSENGPLFFYPGSHRFPYLNNQHFNHGGNYFLLGDQAYPQYETTIKQLIEEQQIKAEEFHAEEGDVLLWHANLIHGGRPINQMGLTRKSMVMHYFAEEVICYHEISQRPALMHS